MFDLKKDLNILTEEEAWAMFEKPTPENLHRIAQSGHFCAAVAEHPLSSKDTLDHLSWSRNKYVKCNIARNQKAPEMALARLAKDEDWDVRCVVAENPNTSADVLSVLVQDKNPIVRCCVAAHPNASADVLAILAQDVEGVVRSEVVKNPNTSADLLAVLAKDMEGVVRREVAENPTWIRRLADEAATAPAPRESAPTTEVGGTFECAVCGVQCRVHENTDPERIKAQMCAEHFDKKK